MSTRRTLVEVTDVSVRFGGVAALRGVSCEVAEGSLHAIIGPNGAGKSTLLNVLSGIVRPTEGTVRVRGVDLARRRPHQMAALGMARAFQNIALYGEMSVLENLMLGRHHLMRSGLAAAPLRLPGSRREERRHRDRVIEIAESLGMAHLLRRRTGELPYGDQKRVELARAICMETPVLLLDEPLAGMNHDEKLEVAGMIRHCHSERAATVILVDHDMPIVMDMADTVTVLDFGRRIAQGTPAEVSSHPAVIAAYLGEAGSEEARS
ncbi:MAG TPA: ABC transporter ATP-binding protein [Spirillospora sp.]